MERPIFKEIGTLAEELDPSSMVVDVEVLDRNIEKMHAFFSDREVKLRPRVDTHLCPAIAHKQLLAGGTVGGIAVATIGQAEIFAEYGFSDILLTNVVVTKQKIARVCALAGMVNISVVADDLTNVRNLSDAAIECKVNIGVVISLNNGFNSIGIASGKSATILAQAIVESKVLKFAGLLAYDAVVPGTKNEDMIGLLMKSYQNAIDTKHEIECLGINCDSLRIESTSNYEIAADLSDVTEVLSGTYALMSQGYSANCSQFEFAARILSVVISTPEKNMAIMDAGRKTIGSDYGLPVIDNVPGAIVEAMSAEHGTIKLCETNLSIGDKLWVVPWDIGEAINLHDYIQVVRQGKLETVWDIPARGKYR